MEIPTTIAETRLYNRLKEDRELLDGIVSLRLVVVSLAETTSRTVPDFTDHTAKHMDALWWVADRVLTSEEINRLTTAEAFLLAAGFYLHDIGMAYAATPTGLDRIRRSDEYRSLFAGLPEKKRSEVGMEAKAVAVAVRQLHSRVAAELSTKEIPGVAGQYLLEKKSFRDAWGPLCGEIASSHHWTISELDARLGPRGNAPLPGNRQGDLLYVAACLRLIDYAHINRDRASVLDRAFRFPLNEKSLIHWLAQEHIDGPVRNGDELFYHSAQSISDVDAWWLYYEMLKGLDNEVHLINRLLHYRSENFKRISLRGVRGASSPEQASVFIRTSGFLPIEVNLKTGSIERLVELLAGETLYGPNPMAAVRELIQNARDAVMLKAEVAQDELERATLSYPIRIKLDTKANPPTFEILDYGIGMNRNVMMNFLISIASDYWGIQFAADFPAVAEKGFKNAGKFGIGFLSVFMLGEEVIVESNRSGGDRYQLSLRGVGRRGELRPLPSPPGSGTVVRIKLRQSALDGISPLGALVRVYAPTLAHSLSIDVDGVREELASGWLGALELEEFRNWVLSAVGILQKQSVARTQGISVNWEDYRALNLRLSGRGREEVDQWPLKRPEYRSGSDRLVASVVPFSGVSVLCLRGLAVQTVSTPGFLGVIDLDSAEPDVSRNRAIKADLTKVLETARTSIAAQIIDNLDVLNSTGLLIEKTEFIASCVQLYGRSVIFDSKIPWVNHMTIPGNVTLVNSSQILERTVDAGSVFIAFNMGPWMAMERWADTKTPPSTEAAFLIRGKGQRGPGFKTRENNVGELIRLWPACKESPLFGALVEIIGQAWQMSPDDLVSQGGWTHTSDEIFGRFVRR